MKKVAGPGATKLRKLIADFNKVRSDRKLVNRLRQIGHTSPDALDRPLTPFYLKNSLNSTGCILNMFKSPYTYIDEDLNKLIDKINDNIISKKRRISFLEGYDATKAFDQKLINKYIKDIPFKQSNKGFTDKFNFL